MTHHADTLAFMRTSEAEHATNVVELNRVVEKILCHELGPERVASHDDGFGYFAKLCPYVGSGCVCHKIVGFDDYIGKFSNFLAKSQFLSIIIDQLTFFRG